MASTRILIGCLLLGAACMLAVRDAQAAQMIENGGFEQGLDGWTGLWCRDQGAGKVALDAWSARDGGRCARILHTGERDWSFSVARPFPVEPGQIYELRGWVSVVGRGSVTLCVTLQDGRDEVLDWLYADRRHEGQGPTGWRELKARFVIPRGAARMVARFVGDGPAVVRVDEVSLTLAGRMADARPRGLPPVLRLSNGTLECAFDTDQATLSVTDLRTGRTWSQVARSEGLAVADATPTPARLDLSLVMLETAAEIGASVSLDPDRPELTVELRGEGRMPGPLAYPYPFATGPGDLLIMPVNEGICYPADDASLQPMHYILYGGHGLCMPWYGVTDGAAGAMAIVETPDDAAVRVDRLDGLLVQRPIWEAQQGQFGYARRVRYVFLDDGGYVAMAKRYRAHAQQAGLLKTLAEKRDERPAVDELVGTVNVWCWEPDAPAICREMQQAGIERILWSSRRSPEEVRELNAMGVLTSRYDIYQDVMNPANFPKLHWTHDDWPTEGWPQDCMVDEHGRLRDGWDVEAKGGGVIACNVLCDSRAPDYARKRIGEELQTHPYLCRFIDTTTASPWRECRHAEHPMTRSDSKRHKMELLRLVGEEFGLVCGSETGHDAAVPYVDYFEGMLSLGPYRVPDAGRDMQRMWDEVPKPVAKFQTGHYYRLPLWELVYHDCVVAQWYWGDYNNKLPALWDRRDLINALYGTPPMFMFNRAVWDEQRDRFARSYQATCPVARACGYSEMTDHRWLTDDHAVQQTSFANGARVTVNFGDGPFQMADGHELAPLTMRAEGIEGVE